MTENFFLDNQDIQFRLEHIDLREVIENKEKGFAYRQEHPTAPRNYADAKDNYRVLLEVLGEICATVIAPRAPEADEEGATFGQGEVVYADATQEAVQALKQAELMGVMLPWEYGGMNLPEVIYQSMVELVSRAEAGLMTIFGLQEIASTINEFGDEETKARILPRFARGEVAGAMVLTEPDAGSDLGAVQTRAFYDEEAGTWRLNGVKRFITNGCAEIQVVLARSEEGTSDARGLSIFLIERDETVKIRRIEDKLGIHSSPTCEIQYNNTPALLIGKQRFGLIRYAMALMNGARLAVSAQALGIAEAAYREAHRYAEERIQFGKPINTLPAVARMLMSMRGEIEAARALIFETGRWVDLLKSYEQLQAEGDSRDPDLRKKIKHVSSLADALTPLTKYYATEMGNRVCYLAMQIHGGVGYMREFNVERHWRDVRITNIYEGTSQLQIVAAIGKLLSRTLDPLLDEWAAIDYGAELAPLKEQLVGATEQLRQSIDHLKGQEHEIIDYYASDLVNMAAYIVNGWLMLQDATRSERKRNVAQVYLAEHLPQVNSAHAVILAADTTPLEAQEAVLSI
ncbi:MAG: acyl-CoA dehydrogenase family protein [Anaerolineae bacterium]|nr:acyl-CoA dehydrogenase family protein [Anaerolineae bacterium]